MIVREEKYLNEDAYILENNDLKVIVLKRLGFKIASIYDKKLKKEFLIQPKNSEYKTPKYGDSFVNYDNSGLNDMIPTLEPSEYPMEGSLKGRQIPDRGEVWSNNWDLDIINNRIYGKMNFKSLPLRFEKSISLNNNRIEQKYRVKNLVDYKVYYLWSMQGQHLINDNTEFIFQNDMKYIINVLTNEDLNRLDISKLKEYRDDRKYKYFFWGKLKKGLTGLDYKDENVKFIIEYDTDKIPYLGISVDKKRSMCSVEPSNTFFDSILVANDNNTAHCIEGKDVDEWYVDILIDRY